MTTFTLLQKTNLMLLFFYVPRFPQNIRQHKVFSKLIIQFVSWAANLLIGMISEGSWDTEDWSNDVQNSDLASEMLIPLKKILKVILNCKYILKYCGFYCNFLSNRCSLGDFCFLNNTTFYRPQTFEQRRVHPYHVIQ